MYKQLTIKPLDKSDKQKGSSVLLCEKRVHVCPQRVYVSTSFNIGGGGALRVQIQYERCSQFNTIIPIVQHL